MKRKIYLVGLLVDGELDDKIIQNYIVRAVKHYHEAKDTQDTFHGCKKPERVVVFEAKEGAHKEMVDFYAVMDRMKGKI